MKVWALVEGSYSDYQIVGITADPDVAKQAEDIGWCEAAEEFELLTINRLPKRVTLSLYRIDPDAPITEDTLIAVDRHSGGQRALVPVEPDTWYCGHLRHTMPAHARSRMYCLEGHLVPTLCGWIVRAGVGGDDD